jgi:hypothetical protein
MSVDSDRPEAPRECLEQLQRDVALLWSLHEDASGDVFAR